MSAARDDPLEGRSLVNKAREHNLKFFNPSKVGAQYVSELALIETTSVLRGYMNRRRSCLISIGRPGS
ncbi:hypothetical protein M3J09_002265 [Ascochyta lentis]